MPGSVYMTAKWPDGSCCDNSDHSVLKGGNVVHIFTESSEKHDYVFENTETTPENPKTTRTAPTAEEKRRNQPR